MSGGNNGARKSATFASRFKTRAVKPSRAEQQEDCDVSITGGKGVGRQLDVVSGQMWVRSKHRKRMRPRPSQMFVTLDAGVLSVRKGDKTVYALDIGQAVLKCNTNRSRFVAESNDSCYHFEFWPVDSSSFQRWKDGLNEHVYYRKRSQATASTIGHGNLTMTTAEREQLAVKQITEEVNKSKKEAQQLLEECEGVQKTITAMAMEVVTLVDVFNSFSPTVVDSGKQEKISQTVKELLTEAEDLSMTGFDEAIDDSDDTSVQPTHALSTPASPPRTTKQKKPMTSSTQEVLKSKAQTPAKDTDTPVRLPSECVVEPSTVPKVYRTTLPSPVMPGPSLSQIFRKLVWNQQSLPIGINLPMTVLQAMCEELHQSFLLESASRTQSAVRRMQLVVAFVMSTYAPFVYRTRKPMNPLLGETYEFECQEQAWRFHGEQVRSKPQAESAGHADGSGWSFSQTFSNKTTWSKLRGSVEIVPENYTTLELNVRQHYIETPTPEYYKWNKFASTVYNLFKDEDQRMVVFHGDVVIKCTNGLSARVTFNGKKTDKCYKWDARILNKANKEVDRVYGDLLDSTFTGAGERLVENSPPTDGRQFYWMSPFAIRLNDPVDVTPLTPPTDSRMRPDLRTFEKGNMAAADEIKLQLEAKQRERRKLQQAGQQPMHTPLWFKEKHDKLFGNNNRSWLTNKKYWNARKDQFQGYRFPPLW